MRGRSRQIKPELFADEQLGDLEQETGLPIFRAFVGLLVFADREGRFRWAPRALKGAIAPCWAGDFAKALDALASKSFIIRYTVNGEDYGYIRSFHKHQTIHPKEAASVLPDPAAHGVSAPSVAFQGTPRNAPEAPASAAGGSGSLLGTLEHAHAQEREVEEELRPRARPRVASAEPKSGLTAAVARTVSLPSEKPTQEYLDAAVIAGISPEQATSTWSHYFGAGLPPGGVERLIPWLVKRAKERANQMARAGPKRAGSREHHQPDAGVTGWEKATIL